MRSLVIAGLATLAWAVAPVRATGAPAARAHADSARALPISVATPDEAALRLGGAAMERSLGNLRGVVENLAGLDFAAEPPFAEGDRAAFLLGQAYLELGARGRFVELARDVARWRRKSHYTRWLAFQLALSETDLARAPHARADSVPDASRLPAGSAEADALAAALLLRDGDAGSALRRLAEVEGRAQGTPLTILLKALALGETGGDDTPEWTRLASGDTTTLLGRELGGAALIRLASRALRRGEDPGALLARVPPGSRYASRARHMLALAALERGDPERGREILAALAAGDSIYVARREVRLALAGLALDRGCWEEAHEAYQAIERDRARQRPELERLRKAPAHDSLWSAWESNAPLSPTLILDALAARTLAERQAQASQDLTSRAEVEIPPLALPAPGPENPWSVPPPPPDVWKAVAASARDLGEAEHALVRARWATACEQETLDARRRYLASGLERARREAADLTARASLLDSLRSTLAGLEARLQAVRDEATRRIMTRTAEALAACARDLTWMYAMRHFHLEGPHREAALPPPAGYPPPDSVLAAEEGLARAIQAMVERMAAQAPGLIARSYERAWRPGLIERAAAQDSLARAALAWARALATSIDSTIAASSTSETLRRLVDRVASLEHTRDSLRAAHETLRAEGARTAIERALAGLETEREAIDYGLAASAYGLGVRLGAPGTADSAGTWAHGSRENDARASATDTIALPAHGTEVRAAPRDPRLAGSETKDELDDPEAVRWRGQAIALHQEFLARHPNSPARGETRFRLADLLLVDARAAFRERMARYMSDQAAGGAGGVPLPVRSHGPALALYRAILSEDPEFEHLDAALFNAGMILADEGSPEAEQLFTQLVNAHPGSPYGQEAYVRMGDMHFNQKRYAESIALYRRAAAGGDPGLQAIALYKMGWAHYNQDRFAEAADAFGTVLDLYGSGKKVEIQADIEGEAEVYLVHSLAGAGGAVPFTRHFGRTGSRPYETRILLALGQHFRRFGLYEQAAAADELFIARYPAHADALLSAGRLVETRQRANVPARVREARLANAARFAPGTAWFVAQTSDSVRAAGSEFARTSMKAVAQEHHQRARQSRSSGDWRAALETYEKVLATWPQDPDAPALALKAGEAGAQLGEHAVALAHYAAAASGPDSIASLALWQRVAVTDAWYESTRGSASAGTATTRERASLGRDSLALAVLAASDELLERFPDHAKGADLMWRQGNLSFAHGWLDRSAQQFGTLAERYPSDARAPRAAILRADAFFRGGKFEDAGRAYEAALAAAQHAGADSLRRRAAAAIPVAYYRHAESTVAEDSARYERHAALFERVATRWPRYEHAHLAQYRAGLAYLEAGRTKEGARAMQAVIDSFPRSEYVRDAHLQIAKAWEADGDREKSAEAHARFAQRYPDDPSAADAWLKAADLYAGAGKEQRAEELRLAYVERYPDDVETAMEVYEGLARRELEHLGEGHPISSLLAAPKAAGRAGTGDPGGTVAPAARAPSRLAEYLRRAKARPDLAARALLAQVHFLAGEEARPAYEAIALRLPLAQSIAAKQKSLDHLMGLYRQSMDLGVPEWAHAATFRIGEALVAFGEALERSQRPADLEGDALRAYEGVLRESGSEFAARGEGVWAELLQKQGPEAGDDPWVARAQGALWQRLGDRFSFRPEVDYPLVAAEPAERKRAEQEQPDPKSAAAHGDSNETRHRPRGEEQPR